MSYDEYDVPEKSSVHKVGKTSPIDFEYDPNYLAIIPQLNYNHHCHEIEFVWLCFGLYIKIKKS